MRHIAHENTQKAKETKKRLLDQQQIHSVSFNTGDIVEKRITKDNLLVWSDPITPYFEAIIKQNLRPGYLYHCT